MDKWLMILFVSGLLGCSNKVLYDSLRLEQRNNCAKEPKTIYFECLENNNQSYEEYERERKEISATQNR